VNSAGITRFRCAIPCAIRSEGGMRNTAMNTIYLKREKRLGLIRPNAPTALTLYSADAPLLGE